MAIINCMECGHKVSDAASACPACARPIVPHERTASREFPPPLEGGARRTRPGSTLSPRVLASLREGVSAARALVQNDSPGSKRCIVCREDVTRDQFRAKRGDTYICMDCQDDEQSQLLQRAARWKAFRVAALVFIALSLLTTMIVSNVGAPSTAVKASRR